MAGRDNFTAKVIRTLAERVGFVCSNPNCGKSTIGPHNQRDKSASIGVAAHIKAAAEGGPRYDSNQTSDERKSIKNAIHLCSNCARIIDVDPNEYPVELLYEWKNKAEEKAKKRQNSFDEYDISEFTEQDLEDIIEYLKNNENKIDIASDLFPVLKRDMENKNKINNMDNEYYKEVMLKRNYHHFNMINNFLKNPQNEELLEKYEVVVEELNDLIYEIKKNGKILYFKDVINEIHKVIIEKNSNELNKAKRRNLLKILLLFMYENCDVGDNA